MWHADLYGYFDAPRERLIALPAGSITQICAADPERVVLIIGSDTNTSFRVTTLSNTGAAGGQLLTSQSMPWILTQHEHGTLAQVAWFLPAGGGFGNLCVIELFLRRKPTNATELKNAEEKLRAAADNRRTSGRGLAVGPWAKPVKGWSDYLPRGGRGDTRGL